MDALMSKEYQGRYEARVKSEFHDLLERATNEPNISDMLGFKDKADSLCKKYLDEFARIPDSQPIPDDQDELNGGGDETQMTSTPKIPKVARSIVADTWYIKNTADIDNYLNNLRKQIEAELADCDEVRLHL